MSDVIAIKVENLIKSYKLYNSLLDRLKETVHPCRKKYHHDFHALNDVSFEILKGETVGIVGRNGSGKSTLLKLITGIATPTSGRVTVNGKVAALLELGAGFNPELTGLENVYFNGIITGFTREEMDRKIDDILSFADIGEFVHQPVKTYSSGMFVRLAFSVAVAVDPDILIIDEALAVGDLAFQLKCMKKLEKYRLDGVTILFVSHDINAIKKFCTKSVWLNNGEVAFSGQANKVVDKYSDFLKKSALSNRHDTHLVAAETRSLARINKVTLLSANLTCSDSFATNDDIFVSISYTIFCDVPKLVVGVAFFDMAGTYICGLNSKLDRFRPSNVCGDNTVVLKLDKIKLLGGGYYIDVGLFEYTTIVALDYISKAMEFVIFDESNTEGFVMLEHEWLDIII